MGYFDFEIHNIVPFGRSVAIILPLLVAIAEYSVYRKINAEAQWTLSSRSQWGDICLKLYIEDGGTNDADGLANGVAFHSSGIGVFDNNTIVLDITPEKSSSGRLSLFALLVLLNGEITQ